MSSIFLDFLVIRKFVNLLVKTLFNFVLFFPGWVNAKQRGDGWKFCRANMISHSVMEMIDGMRYQILTQLKKSKLIPFKGRGFFYKMDLPDSECQCLVHFWRTQLHSPPNGDFCPRIRAS